MWEFDLRGLYIGLKSADDVDVRLYDINGKEIIHWPNGMLSGSSTDSVSYNGVEIEWSGYGGDCEKYVWDLHNGRRCSFGHEFIKIKGTTQNKFIMKAFGYRAGIASVDYSWGKYAIFSGIRGRVSEYAVDLIDGFSETKTWADSKMLKELFYTADLFCSDCMPNNNNSLEKITNNNDVGLLGALAYNVANSVLSYSSFNIPGNTKPLGERIQIEFNKNTNSKVFIVGYSSGGGDAQNIFWKLKDMNIPVEMGGQIDSVELGGDADVPDNVKRAIGFYQEDGFPRGENRLYPEGSISKIDFSKSIVTNYIVSLPQGPSDGSFAFHRNMDNDKRVWLKLLDYVKSYR